MRRLLYLFLIVNILVPTLKANPIDALVFSITELYFDEEDNWYLEIDFPYFANEQYTNIDSITITTSSNAASMNFNQNCDDFSCVFVITEDNLKNNLAINREGESLKVTVYFSMIEVDEIMSRDAYLLFGDVPNSYLTDFQNHQSLVQINLPTMEGTMFKYARDNTPTLGQVNDTNGVCGYLTGKVYDINNKVVPNHNFMLDYEFTTNENGEYKASICSRNYLDYIISKDVWMIGNSNITPFNSNIEPSESYTFDIYLLDDNLVGLIEDRASNDKFKLFPNPASSHITIKGKLNANSEIVITNILGQIIYKSKIDASTNEYFLELDQLFKVGIYNISIIENNKSIYSQQIIINTFK